MRYDYNKLYHYIFGDWSNIDIHIRGDLPVKIKNEIKRKKIAEIQFYFKEIIQPNSQSSKLLKSLLRSNKNKYLEIILFNSIEDKIEIDYLIPNENIVEPEFQKIENQYHCFAAHSDKATIYKKFNELFKLCKLVGDLIEKNNDNTNSLAYLHAYKILVLFSTKNEADDNILVKLNKYLILHNYFNNEDINKPLHDALMHSIPTKTNFGLDTWKQIIKINGPKAFEFFNKAPDIEKQLGRAPKGLNEIIETLKKNNFKRSGENEELANLFLIYHMNEELFNKSLDINKRRKQKDNLPDCVINGDKINPDLQGYHLVKLPIDDPRAFILGKLTNCCQSIGGHSEACVVDGITRENNGFYVLLKQIKLQDEKNIMNLGPIVNNKINYKQFNIVGQCYAYRSLNKQLVIDSWENLSPKRDDPVIHKILIEFARTITKDEKSDIVRVTIGSGGKTPDLFEDNKKKCLVPEIQLEGKPYGDASEQFLVFCNDSKRKKILDDLYNYLALLTNQFSLPLDKITFIKNKFDDYIYSQTNVDNLKSAFNNNTYRNLLLDTQSKLWELPIPSILILINNNVLNINNIELLYKSVQHYSKSSDVLIDVTTAIVVFNQNGLGDMVNELLDPLNVATYKRYSSKDLREFFPKLVHTFSIFKKFNLEKNSQVIDKALRNPVDIELYANEITKTMSILNNEKRDEIDNILLAILPKLEIASQCASNILNAKKLLKSSNLDQDEHIYKLILEYSHLATIIANAFILLKSENLYYKNEIYNSLMERIEISKYSWCSNLYILKHNSCQELIYYYKLLKQENYDQEFIDHFLKQEAIKEGYNDVITSVKSLKSANLYIDNEVKSHLLNSRYLSSHTINIVNAFTYLRKINSENNSTIRNAIFNVSDMNDCNVKIICEIYNLLKADQFEKNEDICNFVFLRNSQDINLVKGIIESIKFLKKYNLDANKELLKFILCHDNISKVISNHFKIVETFIRANIKPDFFIINNLFLNFKDQRYHDNTRISLEMNKIVNNIIKINNLINKFNPENKKKVFNNFLKNPHLIEQYFFSYYPRLAEKGLNNVKEIVNLSLRHPYCIVNVKKIKLAYDLLKEIGINSDQDKMKSVFESAHDCYEKAEDLRQAILLLKEAKLDNCPLISKEIGKHYGLFTNEAKGIIQAVQEYKDEKIENAIVYKTIIADPYYRNAVFKAFHLLKHHGLNHNYEKLLKFYNKPKYASILALESIDLDKKTSTRITKAESSFLLAFCEKILSCLNSIKLIKRDRFFLPSKISSLNELIKFINVFKVEHLKHTKLVAETLLIKEIINFYAHLKLSTPTDIEITLKNAINIMSSFFQAHKINLPDNFQYECSFNLVQEAFRNAIYSKPILTLSPK